MTRLKLKNSYIEHVKQAKILGTIITDNLTWDENCSEIVKKCNKRMILLRKVASFGTDIQTMKIIYIQYIRVILEGSCAVWAGGLTMKNKIDLERCQTSACKIILENYSTYQNALKELNLETLEARRKYLTLKFAMKAKNHDKMKYLFPLNIKSHSMQTRKSEKYLVTKTNTERFKNSPIISMQKMLNEHYRIK